MDGHSKGVLRPVPDSGWLVVIKREQVLLGHSKNVGVGRNNSQSYVLLTCGESGVV